MILGGFLMLPATFEKNEEQLRVSRAVVIVLTIALLAAGFSCTGLLCFAVKKSDFQAESIFLPALISCITGLLTVPYNFLVFTRYEWDTSALLVTVAAAVGSIVYASLLMWTKRKTRHRRTSTVRSIPQHRGSTSISLVPLTHKDSETTLDPNYYNNYNRNMFPAAHPPTSQPAQYGGGFDPHSVTEEEMQRQQMLMLLLQHNQSSAASPDPTQSSSTYNIDWHGRDDEEGPSNGAHAPPPRSAFPQTAYPGPGGEIRPWDGVFRAPPSPSTSNRERARSQEHRDARRQEIEWG